MNRSLNYTRFGLMLASFMYFTVPQITGMLGVNVHTARKIVDSIAAGAGIWTILSLCFAGVSIMAIILATGKSLIKRFGKAVAVTW